MSDPLTFSLPHIWQHIKLFSLESDVSKDVHASKAFVQKD